jgi:hypothetical protein
MGLYVYDKSTHVLWNHSTLVRDRRSIMFACTQHNLSAHTAPTQTAQLCKQVHTCVYVVWLTILPIAEHSCVYEECTVGQGALSSRAD